MATIRAESVWKQFRLQQDRADSVGQLLARMLPARGRPASRPFWALQDISFDMAQGTSLGVIGSNGSGKSTLLKILTRTMQPTRGQIDVHGRVSALIELGAGFHPDFSGRENVVLNASILGIGRREIEHRMEAIIEFSGIRQFIDTPVKYYSSGMHARLGFSVAIHVSPEILIVDEILAVGDEAFQQKCMQRIFSMKRSGVSILLVSHDLHSIEHLMDRAIWLDKGVLRGSGPPRDVVLAYRDLLAAAPLPAPPSGIGGCGAEVIDGSPLVLRAGGVRPRNARAASVVTGEGASLFAEIHNPGPLVQAHVTFCIRRPDGLEVAALSTLTDLAPFVLPEGISLAIAEVDPILLATGQYEVGVTLHNKDGQRLTEVSHLFDLPVQSLEPSPGLLVLPHHWRQQ